MSEALTLISAGEYSEDLKVDFEEGVKVEALDALTLGKAGVEVPDHLIYYDDESIVDDEAFDGDWVEIESDVQEEQKYLTLEMKIDAEVKDWIAENNIDIDSLVQKLIKDAYQTAQLIKE